MLLERLTTLEQSLHGDQRRDRDWLEYLLHPQFCEVTRSGVLVSRDETIDALTQETGTAFIVSDSFTLLPVNAGSAILRYRTCTPKASVRHGARHIGCVWMKRAGSLFFIRARLPSDHYPSCYR